jgi:hypothetical protein
MPDLSYGPPSVAGWFARNWWLFCIPLVLSAYFFFISLFSTLGEYARPSEPSNFYYDTVLSVAPWHAPTLASYAQYKRQFALEQLVGEEFRQVRENELEQVLTLYERASKQRPYWPYYLLGAMDTEYLLARPGDVIRRRLDQVIQLAPNERGIDRGVIELSLFTWSDLRADQREWIASRFQMTSGLTRSSLLARVNELKQYNPSLCTQLPWALVKSACRS